VRFALVSTRPTSMLAAAGVRRALEAVPTATFTVLDVDGTYPAVARERILAPADVGIATHTLHEKALLLGARGLARWLYPSVIRTLGGGEPVVAMVPGVILLAPPDDLVSACRDAGLGVVSRVTNLPDDGRWPTPDDAARLGSYSGALLAVDPGRHDVLESWERLTDHPAVPGDRWVDVVAALGPHGTVRGTAALLSPWTLAPGNRIVAAPGAPPTLLLDGAPVAAVDLCGLDPVRPWLLDATAPGDPRARLSDHPALTALVADVAAELTAPGAEPRQGTWDPEMTALGIPVHPVLSALFRTAHADRGRTGGGPLPDPFDPDQVDSCLSWLTEPLGDGTGRYLRAIHRSRPDLQRQYPRVPGEDATEFLRWANIYARTDPGYPASLVDEALARSGTGSRSGRPTRSVAGVNVVGFLSGELGIGESARLMVDALDAAGIPHATVAVEQGLLGRASIPVPTDRGAPRFDTTLLCVNADLAGSVAAAMPAFVRQRYRIGMWYWEVEDFPTTQHGGFAHVREIWAATDFVRRAIEPHSPVPVHTVTPPLPQRGPAPTLTRADLGMPERPVFLFSFDFLSTAERKNPLGLVDAFTTAFRHGEGPVLVIKSINAHQRPVEAEQLRLRAAAEPDVILMENYLDATERDALMALCDCYVSLHRSEGLGLTMAEAMAWGKPVIATGYSGNLQFMTDENSFLVPWVPAVIPAGAEPYPAGGTWADPDLDAAARMMRSVIEDPGGAAARGARAASDVATLHSPAVAGRQIAVRLKESAGRRRATSLRTLSRRLRTSDRAARTAFE